MHQPLEIAGALVLVLALAGSAYLLFAGVATRAFLAPGFEAITAAGPWPSVTIVKPLHGDEPGLEAALETLFRQDYPGEWRIVMGVRDAADPARAIAEGLRNAHPERDVRLVVDPRVHGVNGKVSNLINMEPSIRDQVLVLSDSDISVAPDYLRRVVAALEDPGVGVVTCPYAGAPQTGVWSRLAAMGLTFGFLPSVAVGLRLGLAKPCMGSTIALRRTVLDEIGGFAAFKDVLADDYAIGAAVRALGLRSVTAPVLVAHGCAESSLRELFAHELRWARTVRGVDPAGFFGSVVTHAVVLALLAVALTGGAAFALAGLGVALVARLWMVRAVEKAAPCAKGAWWLVPARDILSFAVFVGSFFVRVVDWRGARYRVDRRGDLSGI